MSATSATRSGRVAAEARMVDTCTIQRVVSVTADPMTGADVVTYEPDPVYGADGPAKCRVQTFEPQEYTPEAGGHTYTVQRYALHIPVGAYRPEIGDVATIDACVLDPHLVGRAFRVVALLHKTNATAYRLGVTELP